MENLRQTFPRTHCDCKTCVACCQHMPGSLIPGDLELMLQHQKGDNVSPEEATAWLLENFQASEGATAMKIVDGQRQVFKIPTIVPRLTEQGCVFLQEGKCQVHAVAPFACAYVDPHMNDTQANAHSQVTAQSQYEAWEQRNGYTKAWEILHAAGKIAPPLLERKAKLKAAIIEIEGRPSGQETDL